MVRRRDDEIWWRALVIGGIGAFVTGLFGLAATVVSGGEGRGSKSCDAAVQIVTDDDMNASLSTSERTRVTAAAVRRIESCLDE